MVSCNVTATRRENNGFSLVELSIVLVIIGLLVGGILSGQSLIRAAELRAISTEYAAYSAATNTFRDKYMAIAGDMKNATRFWGKLAAFCNSDPGTASTAGTCNGNGSGRRDVGTSGSTPGEIFMFWNQLALAGLITGSYDGIAGSANEWQTVPGQNIPVSRITNSVWTTYYADFSAGSTDFYTANYGDILEFSAVGSGGWAGSPVLKPEEAWGIDRKMDDGIPSRGKLVVKFWNNLCAGADDGSSASNDLNASYRLSDTSAQCALLFTGN